ncbi:ABC transporter permease [Butyrivibrio sp. X503]|uniref:ABC transporter permease n=1 Tax=Butyrivibrio sp. X503 TaxID=2364878 RepID=UPI000EA85229|nr:FtsX-like permease family protein [Butyrivibrio sp. X503]RKM58073.1 ABC transporter permease [Butyrivibrio sp. X503]
MLKDKRAKGPAVGNGKVIRKLAYKSVKANFRKSLVVIVSIALCTLMFATLFTIGGSIISKFQEQASRQVGSKSVAGVKYLTEAEYDRLASDDKLKSVSKMIHIGTAVNDELNKLYTEIVFLDAPCAQNSFCYPEVGRLPEKENEISASSLVLQALGMNITSKEDYEELLGKTVSIKIEGKDSVFDHEFVIVGIHTGDRASLAQSVLVSEEFQKKYAPTPTTSYYDEEVHEGTRASFGRIDAEVDFFFPLAFQYQLDKAVERDGLPSNVETGVNWGYMGSNMDPSTVIFTTILLLTIFLSGYLIISNIYRINVYTDIRSYGLLKTVGTSSKQLKKIIKWQAIFHSIPGITAGLIGGLAFGSLLLPLIMKILAFSETTDSRASVNIWILLFSALFSYITVRISVGKAAKTASRVTPIEAVRFTEKDRSGKGKKRKKKASSFNVFEFALRNVLREKKRCFFVVLSLSLSLTVLTIVYTMLVGFDENKFVASFVATDFSVADYSTDSLAVSVNCYDGVTEAFLDKIKKQDGILNIGNVYAQEYSMQKLNERDFARFKERLLDNENVKTPMRDMYMASTAEAGEAFDENNTIARIYGMDEYPISTLNILHGTYDAEKFKTGKYILVNEYSYGNESGDDPFPYFLPGETVAVNNDDGEIREYEVMATMDIPYAVRIQAYTDMDVAYVLPSEEFLDFFGDRMPMRTLIDTTDEAEPSLEKWMDDYTTKVEPSLTYSSRAVYKKMFYQVTNMFKAVGGLLTIILALIGILNFTNTIVTSVISRRLELAMLEAVGMTKSLQRKSICLEGIIYGGLALVFGALFSSIISILFIKPIEGEMWFFTYRFTLFPICVILPFLIVVMLLIPYIVYKRAMRETVIERLRLADA